MVVRKREELRRELLPSDSGPPAATESVEAVQRAAKQESHGHRGPDFGRETVTLTYEARARQAHCFRVPRRFAPASVPRGCLTCMATVSSPRLAGKSARTLYLASGAIALSFGAWLLVRVAGRSSAADAASALSAQPSSQVEPSAGPESADIRAEVPVDEKRKLRKLQPALR